MTLLEIKGSTINQLDLMLRGVYTRALTKQRYVDRVLKAVKCHKGQGTILQANDTASDVNTSC